jgi:transglutaminase-like putative cysteine protease
VSLWRPIYVNQKDLGKIIEWKQRQTLMIRDFSNVDWKSRMAADKASAYLNNRLDDVERRTPVKKSERHNPPKEDQMNKLTTALVVCFCSGFFTLGCTTIPATPLPPTVDTDPMVTFQAIAAKVGPGNFQGLADWLSAHIKYREDRTAADEWQKPIEVIRDGRDDCEGYAVVALECLYYMGVQEAYIMGVSRLDRKMGHVVCIFRAEKDQNWQFYDFEKLKQGPKDFKDLPYAVARESRYGSHIEYHLAHRDLSNITPQDEVTLGMHN